jgi:hypothetical protein
MRYNTHKAIGEKQERNARYREITQTRGEKRQISWKDTPELQEMHQINWSYLSEKLEIY